MRSPGKQIETAFLLPDSGDKSSLQPKIRSISNEDLKFANGIAGP